MTRRGEVGNVRRSALISTFGAGAIVDLRSRKGAPISGIVSGLEEWDDHAPPNQGGLRHPQRIREPRLQRALRVGGFRAPPVPADDSTPYDVIPVVRFPRWLQCPHCNRVRALKEWSESYPGEPERVCSACAVDLGGAAYAVPVRFIAACKGGHLEEFPWKWWISCKCEKPRLRLEMRAAGLAGKFLVCDNPDCAGKPRSLEGILGRDALKALKCHGEHPWYPGEPDANCPHPLRALQRGASNVYWSRVVSAISIPPYSDDPTRHFGDLWPAYEGLAREDWVGMLRLHLKSGKLSQPLEVLLDALERSSGGGDSEDKDLLTPEFAQFVRGCGEEVREGEFEVVPQQVPPELRGTLSGLAVIQRLREVQVLVSFTRINPPSGPFKDATQKDARLSAKALSWLPASELKGEGIFFGVDERAVTEWENRSSVRERFADRLKAILRDRYEDEELPPMLSPRFLMLHALSHALITRLSLSCGYGSSSIRERIYSTERDEAPMAGVLLLTSTPDADGTLGGLAREGRAERFVNTFLEGLQAQRWCASDPVCITGAAALSSPRNGAACHACMLLPETSCAHFNTWLDRAFLVGTPDQPDIGFFSALLAEFTSP